MTLHDLACRGWAECRCAVLYRVRDSGVARAREAYNGDAGVSGESDSLSRDPAGLLTPGRRDLRVHGSKP